MTERSFFQKSINDSRGFSLVELIICIAILGIATVPLISAFTTSGRVISKAQSMQNATSIAEAVMEEVKGSTIEQLKGKYPSVVNASLDGLNYSDFLADGYDRLSLGTGSLGGNKAAFENATDKPFYILCKTEEKSDAPEGSTDGELFTVVASIDASGSYNGAVGDSAIDANSIELPVIDRIDRGKHAAISKEINRLDSSAVETWRNNWRDKNHKDSTQNGPMVNLTKEVIITIDDPSADADASTHLANVECTVRYYDSAASDFDSDEFHVSEKVYSGTFLGTADSRVYLFYQTAAQSIHTNNAINSLSNDEDIINQENIIITSTSAAGYSRENPRFVYLILQEDEEHSTGDSDYYMLGEGATHMSIIINDGADEVTVSSNTSTDLSTDGVIALPSASATDKTLMVITNLPHGMGVRQPFYNRAKDDYIYAVDVFVYDKNNEEKVHLSSTKDAQNKTTPIPLPTSPPEGP